MVKLNESRVDYWIKKIKAMTREKAKVILIGTHLDEYSKLGKTEQDQIQAALSQVQQKIAVNDLKFMGSFLVSCTDGLGMQDLKSRVLEVAENANHFPSLPVTWVNLLNLLQKEKSKKSKHDILGAITWDRFCEMAKSCHVLSKNTLNVAQFLHDTGNIVHFHDIKAGLNDLVILNPQELAHVMSSIISFNAQWEKGMVSLAQLKMAWKAYPKESHPKLIALLEKFEVAFRIKQKPDAIFIPSLLPEQRPAHIKQTWSLQNSSTHRVGRIYKFAFVPLGFFARLLTRVIHQFGSQIHQDQLVFWRYGIYAKLTEQQEVLIQYSPQKHHLKVFAKWNLNMSSATPANSVILSSERMMITLIQAIETLLENYYSREIQESEEQVQRLIPCSHCMEHSQKKHFFTYTECVKMITRGLNTVTCEVSEKPVRIDFLAPDVAFQGIPIISPSDLELQEKIGSGGFGTVYKGLWNKNGEKIEVAVKELNQEKGTQDDLEKFEEFKREAFIMSSLNHRNLVKLFGITLAPKLSMVMEYVRGGDLHHKFHAPDAQLNTMRDQVKKERKLYDKEWKDFMGSLKNFSKEEQDSKFASFANREKDLDAKQEEYMTKQRALDEEKISWKLRYKVCLDIAKGIKHLHGIVPPIVHRDLRSPNVFLVNIINLDESAEVHAKVADFGLSRQASPNLGEILPTWQWLAPEVIDVESSAYDERADIYSFGIVCWEVATCLSEAPFAEYRADKDKRTIHRIVHEELRPTIPESCPKEMADLIKQCWSGSPKQRPSWDVIVERLENLLGAPCDMDDQV
jgi:serine/threonine protein kinase